ncbi:MAG: hypothetical protein GX089_08150 [Fibrobacter sp.]|nr:hypothetical protein [Fibrobacter sp.]
MILKVTVEPQGPVGTPIRSDTLFGHYCWAVALNEGEKGIEGVINRALNGVPDIVFSDGFPSGYLPLPIGLMSRFFSPGKDAGIGEHQKWKNLKNAKWVKRDSAEKAVWKLTEIPENDLSDSMPENVELLRNTIHRITGTSLPEHGLYQVSQAWYKGIWKEVDIYAFTVLEKGAFQNAIELMFSTGYGRDTTIGTGLLKIKSIIEDSFTMEGSGLKFMSLSRMVPCEDIDMHRSRWSVEAKYGKLWQGTGNRNPFKFPVMQTVPGSLFHALNNKDCYGKVLRDIHKDDNRIIENCMAVPYPLPGDLYGNEEKDG